MQILPAIDLKDGQAVRLNKGIMNSATIYSSTPYEIAKEFEASGSKWVHLVDLNGAFAGEPVNIKQIKEIRKECSLKIELGGGIRDEATIKQYIDLGIDRVILGSIAQQNPEFAKQMAKKYPIVIGIDAIDEKVAVQGWGEVSQIQATDLAKEFANAGVQAIICTDISRDGMLEGVNIDFTLKMARSSGIETIASGGVKDIEDIRKLKNTNEIAGVIIGKAFYENKLDLKDVFLI